MRKLFCGIAIAAVTVMTASSVFADALHFDFKDALGFDNFSFDLPSSMPTPDFAQPNYGVEFSVSGVVNGAFDNFEVNFFNSSASGGLEADDLAFGGAFFFQNGFGQYNPVTNTYQQIYSGAEATPTFASGVFILYAQDPATFESSGVPEGVLTVSEISDAPEPSAWALMMVGVGGVGLMLRRKRTAGALAST